MSRISEQKVAAALQQLGSELWTLHLEAIQLADRIAALSMWQPMETKALQAELLDITKAEHRLGVALRSHAEALGRREREVK